MSETFERFLARLNARGRERGDGFFPAEIVGLTPDERVRARELLIDASCRGDTTAVGGLVLLDGAGANAVLDDLIRTLPFENDVRLSAAHQMWDRTRDPQYQSVILEYLGHPLSSTRLVALGFLQQTPPRPSAARDLGRVIESDTSVNNRALAGELLACWLGIVPRIEDAYRMQREFMQSVESKDVAARRAAVARLHLLRTAA